MKLTYEQECDLLLRRFFGHESDKALAKEFGLTLKEVRELVAVDHALRQRESRALMETGHAVILSPISYQIHTLFAEISPEIFKIEKV